MGNSISEYSAFYLLDNNKRTEKIDRHIFRLNYNSASWTFYKRTNWDLMTERLILSIVAVIMLALTFKKGDEQTTLLTSGLTVGILITWTGVPTVITVGLIIYMLTALLISLTNLRSKELTKFNRTTIVLTGVFAFGANLFSVMHWPYAGEIRLSMIIPIILYIISLVKGMIRRKEFGYLTIMSVEFILRLIR